jgi:iron-sulfur cluster assembly protein
VEDKVMINFSDKAIRKIENILSEEGKTGWGLRVGIRSGGCSGYSYLMQFDEKASEQDHVFQVSKVPVFVDGRSLEFLEGTEIDFSDGLSGSGFVFNNPNAVKSCGCGSSFSA